MAEEFNMNLSTCALNGGEDYELLFTVPLPMHEQVLQIEGVKVIGYITKPELGCALLTRDGTELELKAQGWNPKINQTQRRKSAKLLFSKIITLRFCVSAF